jgi:peptidoglycan/xylan/chitin deacetylase (PgdA/CDA1 family)
MRFTSPLIFCLLLSSCASNWPMPSNNPVANQAERLPSSSVSDENLATSFDKMMSSENPEKEFVSYLSRLKSIFTRTEAYLSEFDKEVDEAVEKSTSVDFESSKPYKKLLVMRDLRNRLQDKITYFYLKLTDVSYDKSQSSSSRKMAKKVLKTFKSELDSGNPLEKLTFDDLKIHIASAIKMRRGFSNKSVNAADVPNDSFKNEEEKVNILRTNREMFRNLGKAEITKHDELSQKIDDESDKIQLVDQNGREPQSEKKFYPSVGTNGNVMGLIFPKGVWALTYDDGPNPTHTSNIVKNLDELGIKATFFWLAQNVVQMQSTVELVKSKGHALANHSWSHQQLPKLSDEGIKKEINMSTEVETKAYGQKVEFFRCPYGAGNSVPRIRQRIADLGMIHVFWNVDTLDWQDKDPDSIVARAQKQMIANGHGVVLFHDIHPQSVIASKKLVEWSKTYKGMGADVRWVTLPEIVKEMNGE